MKILHNESLAKYSSFRTGGRAELLLFPETADELADALCDYPEAYVFGNMSNTLVLDGGIDGAVIITTAMNSVTVNGKTVTAAAGASLSAVACAARDNGLCGCEFLYGIPGTVGGGVFMNAGAYGGELSAVLARAYVLDGKSLVCLDGGDLDFGYRKSILQSRRLILCSAELELERGDTAAISGLMTELMAKRVASQPLDKPSCGSTFKRPEGHFAGKLISDCGLKGTSVGGAVVSEKHAGFIVNGGGATSRDIIELIDLVKRTVYDRTGVMLEEEIRIVGHE